MLNLPNFPRIRSETRGRVTCNKWAASAWVRCCAFIHSLSRDMSSAFQGYAAKQFWVFREDHHPNAAGHAMFADGLLDYLEEDGFLPRW